MRHTVLAWFAVVLLPLPLPDADDDDIDTCFVTPSKLKVAGSRRQRRVGCEEKAQSLEVLGAHVESFVLSRLGAVRTSEMFDVVLSWPASGPALSDLGRCLEHTQQWGALQRSMLKGLERRLLHHGASSTDIISHYIATIAALKRLDPTGVTLEKVGRPMRQYLRGREDAIRCVVSLLMDKCLLREYAHAKHRHKRRRYDEEAATATGSESEASSASEVSDVEVGADEEWAPAPLDRSRYLAASGGGSGGGSGGDADTIGLLVKELFVDEPLEDCQVKLTVPTSQI